MPDVLERLVAPDEAVQIPKTFVPIYSMDESEAGLKEKALDMNRKIAVKYVLKPSLEGGGHHVYGIDIPGFLKDIPEWEWSRFVLMEKIERTTGFGECIDIAKGSSVVSELGVFGMGVWRCDGVVVE